MNCSDGVYPFNGPSRDGSGNLYGTTSSGGVREGGTVYELIPGVNQKFKHVTLYNFPGNSAPESRLIIDSAGNLYGATTAGGTDQTGTIFKMMPPKARHFKWSYSTIYTFCKKGACSDGAAPLALTYAGQDAGIPYDGTSPIFGIALGGGKNQQGTVFSITPKKTGVWDFERLHSFCNKKNCTDGGQPVSITLNSSGNIFGVTNSGGIQRGVFDIGAGTVFKLALNESTGVWDATILYKFCKKSDCVDGAVPVGLGQNSSGSLIGVTQYGGNTNCENGCGIAFQIDPDGSESTVYDFCSKANCVDGWNPIGDLTVDSLGNFFGVTQRGGSSDRGTVFEINSGFETLYSFCADKNCGGAPIGKLLLDPTGNLFGVTFGGGPGRGTAFELTP